MRRAFATIALAAVIAAAPAMAQEVARPVPAPKDEAGPAVCASYEVHARYLATQFGEMPLFTGSLDDSLVIQLFVNRSTGSWTALIVRTDGLSCVTSAGHNGRQDVGL